MRRLFAYTALCALLLAGCATPDGPAGQSDLLGHDPRVPAGSGVRLPGNSTWLDVNALDGVPFPVFQPVPTVIANRTGRELSLAIDPNDPLRMISCSVTGTLVVGDGHSDVFMSLDGGETWQVVDPEPGGDTRDHTWEGGDCDVAIGPDGTMVLADTWLGGLSVGTSPDGVTWTGTAITVTAPIVDRPWLAIDDTGTIHITYQDVQAFMPSIIWYTQSTDGGQTFRPSVPVATAGSVGGGGYNGAFTWTGNFVVSDDGHTLHSIYTRRLVPVLSDQESSGPEQVTVAMSRDGGLTWTSRVVWNAGGPSSWLYPAIGRDDGGVLYVTWTEMRGNDQPTLWRRSDDDGATWSPTQPFHEGIRLRTGAPWVAGGPSGAAFQFLGTPDMDKPVEAQRWWLYWATVGGEPDNEAMMGTTTVDPLHVGYTFTFPEFNTVRVDRDGRIHIAGVVWHTDDEGTGWRPYYFGQVGGLRLAPGDE